MGTIGEITTLLDKIPLWKRLTSMPKELEELQARVAALEAKLAPATGEACPMCDARTFKRASSAPHKIFGDMGMVTDRFRCSSCGHEEDRDRETRQR
jgi:hypothetical protein